MREWLPATILIGLPEMPRTVQGVNARAKRDAWQKRKRQGRGGGWEYHLSSLPLQTQTAIFGAQNQAVDESLRHPKREAFTDASRASLWTNFERKPESIKERGRRAVRAVQLHRKLVSYADAAKAAGQPFNPRAQIICSVAEEFDVSAATIRNWVSAIKNIPVGDWLPILTPSYAGRTTTADISPEAWDYFKADYLRLEAPAAAACFDRLMRIASKRGWTVPSLKTIERKIKRELSHQIIVLAREGVEKLQRTYPAQERDRSVFHALEAVNADGHKFDVFVRWTDNEVIRVVMVAWQDIRSGKILSYRVDRTENTDAVRLSFGDLVERFGIPANAYLDNGRGFASKWMTGGIATRFRFKVKEDDPTGIMPLIGVDVHWASPYHGQAKPIERAFRDLCETVAKHPAFAGAYVGNNPTAKPENYGSRAIPVDKFLEVLDEEIRQHNARTGRTGGICNGRSFDQVFSESYASAPIRKATAEQRRLWLLAAESITVKGDGTIVLRAETDNRYWSDSLYRHIGQPVVVRFDPQQLHDPVHVYSLDGVYICEATCIQAAGFNDTQAAREHSRARKDWMRGAKRQLQAERRMDALEASKLLPTSEPEELPDARIVRPIRPAIDLRPVLQQRVSDEQVEAQRILIQEMEQPEVSKLPESPRQRFQHWVRLKRRAGGEGTPLTTEETQAMIEYSQGQEFKTELEMHREFGLMVDNLPVEFQRSQNSRAPKSKRGEM